MLIRLRWKRTVQRSITRAIVVGSSMPLVSQSRSLCSTPLTPANERNQKAASGWSVLVPRIANKGLTYMRQRTPEFGLILALTIRGLAIQTYSDMRRVVQDADRLDFDSVCFWDHFLTLAPDHYTAQAGVDRTNDKSEASQPAGGAQRSNSIPLLECWTALSALSRETTRLRLGTSVLCNSFRNPAVLAKMAATLDGIREGRLDLGLGAGWFKARFEAYD